MNIDIAKWCRSCKGCRTAKISRHNKPVFGKFSEPTERFDHIHIDIVADAFFSGWIARFGTLATITTDRGAQFESKLWDNLCHQFGIVRNRTTSYHHRQLKAAITAHESPNAWMTTLPAVLLGVRSDVK